MTSHAFRYPLYRPLVPPPERWVPLLDTAWERRVFSNFGPLAERFEGEVARGIGGGRNAVACASATAGLLAVLQALEVRGRAVVLPALTFPATAQAVLAAGGAPVLCDVHPHTWELDPDSLEDALGGDVAAVLHVRVFGGVQDISPVEKLAAARGVPLVVDAAACLGITGPAAARPGRAGMAEVFSLHATKAAGIGEGGVIAADPAWAGAIRRCLNFGLDRFDVVSEGVNGKLSEVAAAIALAMWDALPGQVAARQRLAAGFRGALEGAGPPWAPGSGSWPVFPFLAPDEHEAGAVLERARRAGVEARRGYALPPPPHPAVRAGAPGSAPCHRCPGRPAGLSPALRGHDTGRARRGAGGGAARAREATTLTRVVALIAFKDEVDLLRQNVAHHRAAGVGGFVLMDKCSTDGSGAVADALAREPDVRLLREPNRDSVRWDWRRRMVQVARSDLRADWLVWCDADEFWIPEGGSFAQMPEPARCDVVVARRFNALPDPRLRAESLAVPSHWVVARPDANAAAGGATPWILGPVGPKAMARASAVENVLPGGHGFRGRGPLREAHAGATRVLHLPVRTEEGFLRKMRNVREVLAHNPGKPRDEARHWRRWAAMGEAELRAEYRRQFPAEEALAAWRRAGVVAPDAACARLWSDWWSRARRSGVAA